MALEDLKANVKQGIGATDFLREFRRLMRAKGLKIADMPDDVAKSYLFVLQQAVLEHEVTGYPSR